MIVLEADGSSSVKLAKILEGIFLGEFSLLTVSYIPGPPPMIGKATSPSLIGSLEFSSPFKEF